MSSNTRRVRTASAANNIYRPPAARLSITKDEQMSSDQEAKPSSRQRRPDIQVYVPRARRVATETSPIASTPSPPSLTQPKSSRHRNSSPNVVTPRKKSQKPSENPALLSSTTASSESDIYELDDTIATENHRNSKEIKSDSSSKYLPYFVKSDILLPNSELVSEKVNKKEKLYNKFVKSNETYSSTNYTETIIDDDKFTQYLENSTKIETEFSKFLQKDQQKNNDVYIENENSQNSAENCQDRLTEYLQKAEKLEVEKPDKLTEYLQNLSEEQISSQNPDKLTEYIQNLAKCTDKPEPTDRLTEYIKNLPKSNSSPETMTSVEAIKPAITPPILKISNISLVKEEPLDALGKLIKEEAKKAKRTSSGKSLTKSLSENGKSLQESPISKKSNLNIEECSWDMLFDENGDCLEPSIMDELTKQVGKVKVERPTSDYTAYENAREAILAETDFPHVLEVYGFPAEFKTQDLMAVLTPLAGRAGFDLKWVDDTHALAVFSNSHIAAEVLSYQHPMLKTRPLSQACAESKQKARRSGDFLQPYRARPETCTAMAKRLVSSALGVRLTTSKEEREKERTLLKEAREKKRLAARQSEEAWEGKISSK